MRRPRSPKRWLAAVAALVVLTGCGLGGDPLEDPPPSPEKGQVPDQPVRIGWVGGEQELIAEAYAGALRADGAEASTEKFETRAESMEALAKGEVDVVPEYSAEALLFFDQGNPAVGNRDEELAALDDAAGKEVAVGTAAESGSRLIFAIPPAVTEQYDLSSLADAGTYLKGKTLGGPADLAEAPYGPPGLKGLYGLDLKFRAVPDADAAVKGLEAGTFTVVALRSTDPRVEVLVILDDPQQMTPNNAIVPLIRAELTEGPVATTIDKVQAALDEKGLLELTADPETEAEEAAAAWLKDRDLN
ncbi:glycine betaine ABC transporter substrate-binding protein [Enemella sp. A6]|uniref:glycine betaine ABC transporter substrate-binding protein n=1 Tax=Enemella sp. A6 TaxID=3440152 RepID=UPI003EB80E47